MTGIIDRVKCFTSATGTSDAAIGAAFSTKHMTPSEAGAIDGKSYVWLYEQGNDFELVRGTWTASGGVAARTTVLWSKIGGTVSQSKMNLGGTATVSIVAAAEDHTISQPPVAKSAGFTVGVGDGHTLFLCSGTITVAASAAATLGSLFKFKLANTGSGVVTFDPNSSELIDGASTMVLLPGESAWIECDGTGFTSGRGHGSVPYDRSVTLSSGQQTTAQDNLGGSSIGKGLFTAASAGAARAVIAGAVAKSSNYTVAAGDAGSTIRATSALTLSLTAAATLGANFMFDVINAPTSGIVTIDPNSSETINGAATLSIFPGERATIVCDGSNWSVFGLAPTVLLNSQSVSGASAVSFVSLFDPSFSSFEVRGFGIVNSASDYLGAQVSSNAGSSWYNGSTDYRYNSVAFDEGGGALAGGSSTLGVIPVCQVSNASLASFEMELFDLNRSGTGYKTAHYRQAGSTAGGGLRYLAGSARLMGLSNSVANGLRFIPNSGTITVGTFNLYGKR